MARALVLVGELRFERGDLGVKREGQKSPAPGTFKLP